MKDGAYVINVDQYKSTRTNWIVFHVNRRSRTTPHDVTYFDGFRVEYIPKEIKRFIAIENIATNIYRLQVFDSIMCGYFCITNTVVTFKEAIIYKYTDLVSPDKYKNNEKIIYKYCKD